MFCTNCGENIEKHWKFCVGCGFATGTSSLPEEKLTDGPSMPCPDTDKDGSCFDNLYRALTPEARKSVNLLKMKISKKDHIEPSLSQNVMLSIQLIGMDRKLVRMLGSTPGRINMLVNRNSGPLEWANLVAEKINIKTVQPEELKFLLNKTEHEFVFSMDEVKKRATSRHRKELEVFCLLPKTRMQINQAFKHKFDTDHTVPCHYNDRRAYIVEYIDSDKGTAKLKCATVSKVNADHESKKQKCETVSKTETCVYIEEDEEEDETRASPQKVIPASAWPVFSKSVSMATTARPDSATPGATCSHTMETSGPSIETLKKPEIATGIAECTGPKHLSQSPAQLIQVRKESPSDWWDGELQPSRSNDVSRSQAVKEMADYYAMMERKHSRQKAASDRMLNKLRDQSIQSVQKTVVYTEHGGISYSFKVNRDSTIKDVYDRVCQLVPSEILPAKFVLHSRAGEEYDIMSEKVIEETPPVLFLKEQKMDNLNDTLTNFEEVFF